MKHVILFLTFKLLCMTSNAQTTAAADQVRKLEKAETAAFLKNDFEALNKIWHPGLYGKHTAKPDSESSRYSRCYEGRIDKILLTGKKH